jgi:hypothetical protein
MKRIIIALGVMLAAMNVANASGQAPQIMAYPPDSSQELSVYTYAFPVAATDIPGAYPTPQVSEGYDETSMDAQLQDALANGLAAAIVLQTDGASPPTNGQQDETCRALCASMAIISGAVGFSALICYLSGLA